MPLRGKLVGTWRITMKRISPTRDANWYFVLKRHKKMASGHRPSNFAPAPRARKKEARFVTALLRPPRVTLVRTIFQIADRQRSRNNVIEMPGKLPGPKLGDTR